MADLVLISSDLVLRNKDLLPIHFDKAVSDELLCFPPGCYACPSNHL